MSFLCEQNLDCEETFELISTHTNRGVYSTQENRMKAARERSTSRFWATMPDNFARATLNDTMTWIEDALANSNWDRARNIAYFFWIDNLHSMSAADQARLLIAQTDAIVIRNALSSINNSSSNACGFHNVCLRTAASVTRLLRTCNDRELALLLEAGAPKPSGTQLLDLLAMPNMPRTIAYLLDNNCLDFEQLDRRHLEACINTPHVRMARTIAECSPDARQYLASLDAQRLRRLRLIHFYWNVRVYVNFSLDSESLSAFKKRVDTSEFTEADVLALCRARGADCFVEMSDYALLQTWNQINDESYPHAVWKSMQAILERYVEPKIDVARFFFEASTALRILFNERETFEAAVSTFTLPSDGASNLLVQWDDITPVGDDNDDNSSDHFQQFAVLCNAAA